MPAAARGRARLPVAAAWILALAFAAQNFAASEGESLTWDEPGYIAAGYINLTLGDYSLNSDHPPLLHKLMALPLLIIAPKVPLPGFGRYVNSANPRATYGRDVFFEVGNDPIRMTRYARAPIILLGAVLVLCTFFWGRALFGDGPALLATALVALCPNLAAHGRLATEDFGCALGMFASVWTLWRAFESPSLLRSLTCGVVTGLALLTKYTALLLAPIFLILALAAWWQRRASRPLGELVGTLAVTSGIALLLVGLAYGLQFRPDFYFTGVFHIYPDKAENYASYLWGYVSMKPIRYHALVSWLLKTPPSALALLGIAGWLVWRAPRSARNAFLLVPPLVVFAASFFDVTNPGVRRVLPAIPFLLLFAGQALPAAVAHPRLRTAALVLLALSFVEAARTWPHHLSYLSPLVGGAANGPYILDESNIDWGQDLPALADWQAHNMAPHETLRLYYFGSAEPEAYGVRWTPFTLRETKLPEPGIYAVSAHYLAYFRKLEAVEGMKGVDWLSLYQPIARAGQSIYIYEFPPRQAGG
jgi:hypothetical protein